MNRQQLMVNQFLTFTTIGLFFCSCGLDTVKEAGIKYSTKAAFELPENIEWTKVGFAKELINIKDNKVLVSGGDNPIPLEKWDELSFRLPWQKNIDRHLMIDKTAFLRSPNAPSNCSGADCLILVEYKDHSWIELATPLAIEYIPAKTDMLKPEKGHLVVKVIKKCQLVVFENEIYQLSDDKGNKYVMHATETGTPDLNVVLPKGFKLEKMQLDEPLIIIPFGEKEDCYFNIVGDHLGQGYHQYEYANAFYPK